MKRIVLAILLAVIMTVSLFAVGAAADNSVPYVDADGTPQTCTSATEVTANDTKWTGGWYVAEGSIKLGSRVSVSGNVSLILADGCTLNATRGISVTSGNSLTIYGQSGGTGKLTARAYQVGSCAGIGGNTDDYAAHGNITINGGTIEATSYGGAGIGSGSGSGTSDKPNGTITINGGRVTATANGSYGAGIGGGYFNNIAGGNIVITGGTVVANGAVKAAGIGTGYSDQQPNGRSITISGGTVTANGGKDAAGIGGGQGCKGKSVRSITINGSADVTANGGERGAGIGSGYGSTSNMTTTITIGGSAVVKAQGGAATDYGGAGIGSGGSSGGIGNININGGTVTATGGTATDSSMYSGAGIGSGGYSKSLDMDNWVYIPATGTLTINAGTITATGGTGAAGIGDGEGGKGGDFSTGTDGKAVIYASSISDKDDTSDWGGIIFQDKEGTVYGDVTLSDDLSLAAGQTMTVPADSSLTVPEGKKLTVTGALTNNGLLSVAGTMDNKGTIQNAGQTVITGTITGNEIKGTPTVNNPEATYTGANDVTTYYETIGDAIDASNKNGGGTVTLLKDAKLVGIHNATPSYSDETPITYIMANLKLDLGTHTLTCNDPIGFAVYPDVTFTIDNGTYKHASNSTYGTAIEGTKYSNPYNGCTIIIAENAIVEASDDAIVADGSTTIKVYGKIVSGNVAVYGFGPTNTIKIEGAEIVAGGEAVRQDAYHETASKDRAPSNITITDSNIKTTAANGISILISSNEGVASGNHTLNVTSSEITGAHGIVVMGTNATISGDDTLVNALNGYALAIANNNEGDKSVGTMTINGGTFIGQIGVLTPAAGDTAITMGDNCYLVTIDTNDGSTPLKSVTITTSSYTLPAAPTRNGYTFQGWYDGTDLYAAEDNVPITGNTTFTARWIKTDETYSLSLDPASLNLLDVDSDTITVTADVPDGYKLVMTNSDDSVAAAELSDGTITVTAKNAGSTTISVSIVSEDGVVTLETETCNVVVGPSYAITIVYGNGTKNDIVFIPQGEDYKLPTAPTKPGYIFLGWRNGNVTYGAGDPVVVTSDMTFYAVWANMPDVTPGTPGGGDDEPVAVFPFNDVSVLDWFYDSVYYVWENDLMNGTDVNQFSPNSPLTRAMVWAVLARVDGETISGDSWMTEAQAWAVESGVSDGTDPTGYVTREQLVTMLYRFAGEPAGAADISGYPDAASISDWAADAMAWAVKVGLIEGDDVGALNPTANSTRAHAATFFMRFSKTIL